MFAKVNSAVIFGIDASPVTVEADIASGLPVFNIVGLPDKAVEEAKERVKSAIKNSGYFFPNKKVTINLAPADIKKEGAGLDLPIALGILISSNQIQADAENFLISGELALNGTVRPIKGTLQSTILAKEKNINNFLLPKENRFEASIIDSVKTFGISTLTEAANHLSGIKKIKVTPKKSVNNEKTDSDLDMEQIYGQDQAKRALEIAASGGHNVAFWGPPGSGKTFLAKAFNTILPELSFEESLEVTKVHSACGLTKEDSGIIDRRPLRSPHHTASEVSLVGGSTNPKPGEISLAHRGVLFLDEINEFPRSVIEILRQPLEEGNITISRAARSVTFPANFILIAASNPCPCGYFGDSEKECRCSAYEIEKYQKRISGPILDRIDIHLEIPRVKKEKIMKKERSEKSEVIRKRVEMARKTQFMRFTKGKLTNSEMNNKEVEICCTLTKESEKFLDNAFDQLGLSARAYYKILKVARTIADLDSSKEILPKHLAEAAQYRLKT